VTECNVPWRRRKGRRIDLYFDQFGSFHAVSDSISSVFVDIHKRSRGPLRMVNLLEDDSDEDSPADSLKIQLKGRYVGADAQKDDEEMANPEGETPFVAGRDAGVPTDVIASEAPRVSSPNNNGEKRQEVHDTSVAPSTGDASKFFELGTSLIPHRTAF